MLARVRLDAWTPREPYPEIEEVALRAKGGLGPVTAPVHVRLVNQSSTIAVERGADRVWRLSGVRLPFWLPPGPAPPPETFEADLPETVGRELDAAVADDCLRAEPVVLGPPGSSPVPHLTGTVVEVAGSQETWSGVRAMNTANWNPPASTRLLALLEEQAIRARGASAAARAAPPPGR